MQRVRQLTRATLVRATLAGANLDGANLSGANLQGANLSGTVLVRANLDGANLMDANLEGAVLGATIIANLDATPLCNASVIRQKAPSRIDWSAVAQSYLHPRLKQFMVDCGTPPLFAEFMIDTARALGDNLLRVLMQSTFISYGGPDEAFAQRLYDALRAHGVVTFFFPDGATVGERINNEVFRRIQEHDRVLLVCSRKSLNREGVVNEVQETLDREAKLGAATLLLPIMLDDYVLKAWKKKHPVLAERIARRVIADFRDADTDPSIFDRQLARVIDALKKKRPAP